MPFVPKNAADGRRFQKASIIFQTIGLVAGAAIGAERLHGGGDAGLIGGEIGENRVGIRSELRGLGLEVVEVFPDGGSSRAACL